jgi:hypothetical protein
VEVMSKGTQVIIVLALLYAIAPLTHLHYSVRRKSSLTKDSIIELAQVRVGEENILDRSAV